MDDKVSSQHQARVLKWSPEQVAEIAAHHGIEPDEVGAEHLQGFEPDEITEGKK